MRPEEASLAGLLNAWISAAASRRTGLAALMGRDESRVRSCGLSRNRKRCGSAESAGHAERGGPPRVCGKRPGSTTTRTKKGTPRPFLRKERSPRVPSSVYRDSPLTTRCSMIREAMSCRFSWWGALAMEACQSYIVSASCYSNASTVLILLAPPSHPRQLTSCLESTPESGEGSLGFLGDFLTI